MLFRSTGPRALVNVSESKEYALAPSAAAPVRAQRQQAVVTALAAVVPAHALLWQAEDTTPYECDGLTAYRERPLVVVLPETEEQVAAVLKTCHALQVPVVARGAGTGLSGGAMPHALGVTLSLAKFNRILAVDLQSRTATVQCGVRNLAISEAAAPYGLYYAPDPSSQIACTIGGNVAENSGGVHCLKYGLTTNNVLGLEIVLVTGEILRLGGRHMDTDAYDLLGAMTGSEGLLGVITEVTVRLLPKPQRAQAVVNCRVLPGESVDEVKSTLERVLGNERIKVTPMGDAVLSPPAPLDARIMGPVESIAAAMWPGVPIVPTMSAGATDSRFLNNAGIPTYGISGMFSEPGNSGVHANDERIAVQSLYDGQEFLYRLVKRLANP